MTDFSLPIANTLKAEFPSAIRSKCFFSLKENVRKLLGKDFKEIENYLDSMGFCLIEQELQILWEISKADLPKQLPPGVAETFIHYFETTY